MRNESCFYGDENFYNCFIYILYFECFYVWFLGMGILLCKFERVCIKFCMKFLKVNNCGICRLIVIVC